MKNTEYAELEHSFGNLTLLSFKTIVISVYKILS